MGVRSGIVGPVLKPIFDPTKSKGGRRSGLASVATAVLNYLANDGASQVSYEPQSAFYSASTNKTWIFRQRWDGVNQVRKASIIVYDHATKTASPSFDAFTDLETDDDHGNPAAVRDPNGYVHAFGGIHNTTYFVYSSTSTPDDPSSFVTRNSNPPTVSSGGLTYPAPFFANGTLFLACRYAPTGGGQNMPYGYFKASSITSGVASWGSFQQMMDFGSNSRTYSFGCQVAPNGTDVYFTTVRADYANTFQRDVYLMVLDTTTGNVRNIDGSVTVAAASLPITLSQAQASFRVADQQTPGVAGGINSLALDSSGHPFIVYQESAVYGVAPLTYKYARWTGSAWETGTVLTTNLNGGSQVLTSLAPLASGGMRLYCGIANANYGFARSGDIATVVYTPGSGWGAPTTILQSGGMYALTNPVAPTNASPDIRVIFSEQCPGGNGLDPTIYGGNLRQHAYGDSGFITQPYSESAETTAYFARYSVAPAQDLRMDVDEIVKSLKQLGSWSLFDAIYLGVNQDRQSSSLNLVKASYDATINGAVTVGAYSGWQLDGTSGYVDSGFVPSTAGGQYTQNSASISAFVLSDGVQTAGDFGLNTASPNPNTYGFVRYTGDVSRVAMSIQFGTTGTQTVASAIGLFTTRRTGASAQSALLDGVSLESDSSAGTALVTTSLKLGTVNNTSFSGRKYGAFLIGAGIGYTNQGVVSNILRRFFTKRGALGIPTRNFLRYSNGFTSAAWGKGSAVTLTAAYAAGPDGTAGAASRMQMAGGATSTTGALTQTVYDGGFTANSVNQSIYVKSNTGSAQGIIIYDGTAANPFTVPTTWTRLSVIGNNSGYRVFNFYPGVGPNSEPQATDILIAYAQSEPGAPASAYKATV